MNIRPGFIQVLKEVLCLFTRSHLCTQKKRPLRCQVSYKRYTSTCNSELVAKQRRLSGCHCCTSYSECQYVILHSTQYFQFFIPKTRDCTVLLRRVSEYSKYSCTEYTSTFWVHSSIKLMQQLGFRITWYQICFVISDFHEPYSPMLHLRKSSCRRCVWRMAWVRGWIRQGGITLITRSLGMVSHIHWFLQTPLHLHQIRFR